MTLAAVEAAIHLARARLRLRTRSFAQVQRQIAAPPRLRERTASASRIGTALDLGRVVARAAGRVPFRCNCLVQSLALILMLHRRGISADLRIGVRRRSGTEGRILAHAWVEYESTVLLDSDHEGEFVPFDLPQSPGE